ncbi:uncharacterized protein AMSG_06065 [Thecamonas trahens ATCC 50062]|uniref:Uncharacterized protein n=1 Tax=Thecamonas trahens ATCC 50062 TaxID=461836 RepID=A0A0L0DCG7_THETB|nr:hypothetical protein AMSG_06065 [Thecamonas trahens ATCC 50062]KNC49786.1 hypothetical protein AMSG_06065 [Thecamonas trahens ATCC 50062]|eukprot:XP_013757570.1 hypothetical protein AMSG_06065 [Thecamonas trahens ATCC 50062]
MLAAFPVRKHVSAAATSGPKGVSKAASCPAPAPHPPTECSGRVPSEALPETTTFFASHPGAATKCVASRPAPVRPASQAKSDRKRKRTRQTGASSSLLFGTPSASAGPSCGPSGQLHLVTRTDPHLPSATTAAATSSGSLVLGQGGSAGVVTSDEDAVLALPTEPVGSSQLSGLALDPSSGAAALAAAATAAAAQVASDVADDNARPSKRHKRLLAVSPETGAVSGLAVRRRVRRRKRIVVARPTFSTRSISSTIEAAQPCADDELPEDASPGLPTEANQAEACATATPPTQVVDEVTTPEPEADRPRLYRGSLSSPLDIAISTGSSGGAASMPSMRASQVPIGSAFASFARAAAKQATVLAPQPSVCIPPGPLRRKHGSP